jgi:hypothetical protein
MSDYIEVNERIIAFKAAHPEGSLQAEIHTLTDKLVVMKAYAYRTPDDERPGVGWSSLQIPGATNFTRNAEVENCETSAWGRAIAALGFEVKRGIASKQEVANKPNNEPVQLNTKRMCSKHPDAELKLSRSTGKRGHVLPDGTACVEEESA